MTIKKSADVVINNNKQNVLKNTKGKRPRIKKKDDKDKNENNTQKKRFDYGLGDISESWNILNKLKVKNIEVKTPETWDDSDWDAIDNHKIVKANNESISELLKKNLAKYGEIVSTNVSKVITSDSKDVITNHLVSSIYIKNGKLYADYDCGASTVALDIEKEVRWMNTITFPVSDENGNVISDVVLNKQMLEDKNICDKIVNMGVYVNVNNRHQSGSIWDGMVQNFRNELTDQLKKTSAAYQGKIINYTYGGYIVKLNYDVEVFMPMSNSSIKRIAKPEAEVGKDIIVIVDSYDNRKGFIVSHRKYLKKFVMPKNCVEYQQLMKDAAKEKTEVVINNAEVSGTSEYGIFLNIGDDQLAMIYKFYMSDELQKKFKNKEIEFNTIIPNLYLYNISEKCELILTDIPKSKERDKMFKELEKTQGKQTKR